DHGLASLALRPFTVYGPGRDQGLTAGPTLAIAAALRGEPYRIAFGGRTQLHYPGDVARALVPAARPPPARPAAAHPRGGGVAISDVARLIEDAVPGAEVSVAEEPLPFPPELPQPWYDAPLTPLEEGIRETVEALRRVV